MLLEEQWSDNDTCTALMTQLGSVHKSLLLVCDGSSVLAVFVLQYCWSFCNVKNHLNQINSYRFLNSFLFQLDVFIKGNV